MPTEIMITAGDQRLNLQTARHDLSHDLLVARHHPDTFRVRRQPGRRPDPPAAYLIGRAEER